MYVYFKFLHLLVAVTLIGFIIAHAALAINCYRQPASPSSHTITFMRRLHLSCITLIFSQVVLGSVLIYPAGFTYHTPWIIAAYLLLGLITLLGLLNGRLTKTLTHARAAFKLKTFVVSNGLMLICFYLIVHDAITKHTIFPL